MITSFLNDFIAYTSLDPFFSTKNTLPKLPLPITFLITKSDNPTFLSPARAYNVYEASLNSLSLLSMELVDSVLAVDLVDVDSIDGYYCYYYYCPPLIPNYGPSY